MEADDGALRDLQIAVARISEIVSSLPMLSELHDLRNFVAVALMNIEHITRLRHGESMCDITRKGDRGTGR